MANGTPAPAKTATPAAPKKERKPRDKSVAILRVIVPAGTKMLLNVLCGLDNATAAQVVDKAIKSYIAANKERIGALGL